MIPSILTVHRGMKQSALFNQKLGVKIASDPKITCQEKKERKEKFAAIRLKVYLSWSFIHQWFWLISLNMELATQKAWSPTVNFIKRVGPLFSFLIPNLAPFIAHVMCKRVTSSKPLLYGLDLQNHFFFFSFFLFSQCRLNCIKPFLTGSVRPARGLSYSSFHQKRNT